MEIIEDYPVGDSGTEDVFIENEDLETVDVFEDPETDDVFEDPEMVDVFEDTDIEEPQIEEVQIEEVQSDSDSENGSADVLLSTAEQSEEVNNEPLSDDSGSSGTASGSSEGVAYDDSGILAALSELSYNQRIICAFLALSSGINVGFLIFDRAFK